MGGLSDAATVIGRVLVAWHTQWSDNNAHKLHSLTQASRLASNQGQIDLISTPDQVNTSRCEGKHPRRAMHARANGINLQLIFVRVCALRWALSTHLLPIPRYPMV
jgi:hypothetical protein